MKLISLVDTGDFAQGPILSLAINFDRDRAQKWAQLLSPILTGTLCHGHRSPPAPERLLANTKSSAPASPTLGRCPSAAAPLPGNPSPKSRPPAGPLDSGRIAYSSECVSGSSGNLPKRGFGRREMCGQCRASVLAHHMSDNGVTQDLHAGSSFCGGICLGIISESVSFRTVSRRCALPSFKLPRFLPA
jgi:hypothetical protein